MPPWQALVACRLTDLYRHQRSVLFILYHAGVTSSIAYCLDIGVNVVYIVLYFMFLLSLIAFYEWFLLVSIIQNILFFTLAALTYACGETFLKFFNIMISILVLYKFLKVFFLLENNSVYCLFLPFQTNNGQQSMFNFFMKAPPRYNYQGGTTLINDQMVTLQPLMPTSSSDGQAGPLPNKHIVPIYQEVCL